MLLVNHGGGVVLWKSFNQLDLEPITEHLEGPVTAASAYCQGDSDEWQAAVALASAKVLLLEPAWQISALQTTSIGLLCKGSEVCHAS